MEFQKIPYVVAALNDAAANDKYVKHFYYLSEKDTEAAGKLMQTMVTTVTSLTAKIANFDPVIPEQVQAAREMAIVKEKLNALAQRCAEHIARQHHNLLSYVIWRVKSQRALGNQRGLDRLRNIMRVCYDAVDRDECESWMADNYDIVHCDDCNEWEYASKSVTPHNTSDDICRYCIENNYVYSDRYDAHINHENATEAIDSDGGAVWIDREYEDSNGTFEYRDSVDRWCHVDYEPPPPPIIGNYHGSKYDQVPIKDEWSTQRHRWFGVELEVEIKDGAVDPNDKARLLNDLLNDGQRGKRVFFERDGSLSNGFEIISQPMSLPAHRELWSWLRDRDACRHLLSHNTRTCGLHVHVNKDNLSQLQIAKIVTFINDPKNEQLIRAIARRYAEGYCKIKQKDINSAHQSTDRYEAVNITSSKTIEFRVFKGSLKYESVLAAIEFCNALVDFAAHPISNDVTRLTTDHFIEFINNQGTEESSTLRPYINAVLQTA